MTEPVEDKNIAGLVEDLVKSLDSEASLLELRCVQLEALATAALQRDEEAMEELLAQVERTQLDQTHADIRLESIRTALGAEMAVPVERLRLAWLVEQLPARQSAILADRRARIIELTERLQRRHMETAVVITECSRVNGMLLESFCPSMRSVTTYGAGGKSSGRWASGLVDVES